MTEHDIRPAPESDAAESTGPLPVVEALDDTVWADDPASDGTADDVWAEDGSLTTAQPATDPVVHALLVFAMALVVTLVATTGALYFYLSTLNKAPRTVAERDVAVAETLVAEEPQSAKAWATLAYAYARVGRTDDALDALTRADSAEEAETLALVRADVLRLAGRHEEAIPEYDRALKATLDVQERVRNERAKVGITGDITEDQAVFQVYWGRGLAKKELGQVDGAIADLELASKENSRQVDVWVGLGDLYAQKGANDKAADAYRSALLYVPDLEDALAGLRRLGEE